MADMMQNLQNMQPQQLKPTQNNTPQGTFWGGRPEFTQQTPLLTGQQQGTQNQALQQLMQMLQGGDQNRYEGFEPIAQEARENFATQTIPGLATRFTNMGTQRSGAYKNALQSAGSQFERGLAGLKSQYGFQNEQLNQSRLGQLGNLGFKQSFENNHFARQPGFGEQAGQGIAGGIAALLPLLGLLFGGPAGAAVGGAGGAGLSALLTGLGGAK